MYGATRTKKGREDSNRQNTQDERRVSRAEEAAVLLPAQRPRRGAVESFRNPRSLLSHKAEVRFGPKDGH